MPFRICDNLVAELAHFTSLLTIEAIYKNITIQEPNELFIAGNGHLLSRGHKKTESSFEANIQLISETFTAIYRCVGQSHKWVLAWVLEWVLAWALAWALAWVLAWVLEIFIYILVLIDFQPGGGRCKRQPFPNRLDATGRRRWRHSLSMGDGTQFAAIRHSLDDAVSRALASSPPVITCR